MVCMCVFYILLFFVHSSFVGYHGCLYNSTTVKRAATNMDTHVFLLHINLHSFGYMPQNGSKSHKINLFLVF
jgi:hypothetical protein